MHEPDGPASTPILVLADKDGIQIVLSREKDVVAAEMQAIIIYLIFVGAVLSSLVATRLHRRTYFTPFGAFREAGGRP